MENVILIQYKMSLISKNPFELLRSEHEKPSKVAEVSPATMLYNVEVGSECVDGGVFPAQMDTGGWCPTSTTFFGSCHNCKYKSHSQRMCPIRKCAKCGLFGHAASVCEVDQFL
jgi:hypothetical protein